MTVVRICVQRYKCFFDPEELSHIEYDISVLVSGRGKITEMVFLADMYAQELEVRYMELIRPLAERYAIVLAQQDTDLDNMMGAMTITHVNREPG